MRGTVISVDPNASGVSAAGRRYTFVELVVNTPKGKRTYKIFPNNKCVDDVRRLSEGDNVELTFDTSGKFPELTGVAKSAGGGNGGGGGVISDEARQDSIAKSVALKAAVDFAVSYKDRHDQDSLMQIVIHTAKVFEAYLKGELAEVPQELVEESGDDAPF